ncbi:MAG: hypothetical protein P4L46_10740 [Fimbriimonas sp.]|nr:hypothetical protein [Fimbriimonas sp.]
MESPGTSFSIVPRRRLGSPVHLTGEVPNLAWRLDTVCSPEEGETLPAQWRQPWDQTVPGKPALKGTIRRL